MRTFPRTVPLALALVSVLALGAGSPALGAPAAPPSAASPRATAAGPRGTNLYGLDGLFITTTGTTLPAGSLAVGGSFLMLSDDALDVQATPVTLTYAFSNLFELGAAFDVYRSFDDGVNDESGTGDMYLSVKYAAQPRTSVYPATAVGARLKLPTADEDKGLGSGEADFAIFAAVDLMMGSVQGLLNVEYLIVGEGAVPAENMVNHAIGLKIPYSDTVDFSLELLDQFLDPRLPNADIFVGGATFDMGSALNFGFAVGVGLNDPAPDFAVQGKFTFSL